MSLTSTTPNIKTFWQRPEGTTGKIILLLGILGAIWGLALTLPIIEFVLANTIYTIFLALVLAGILYLLFNRQFRTLTGFMFKSLMRKLTSLFIEIDPIGILKNFIVEMEKQQENLKVQISKVAGAQQTLKDNIAQNLKISTKCYSEAQEAKRRQDASKDPIEINNMTYKIQEKLAEATRRTETNKELSELSEKVDRIYTILIRWSQGTQYYINDRKNQVTLLQQRRKAVNSAYSAMSSAKRILRGSADANALYDQTLEFLAEDAGQKVGEMVDFSREAENFLTDLDLENGAASHDAIEKMEQMSKKLLPASNSGPGFIDAIPAAKLEYQPVLASKQDLSASSGYEDIFRK
jgi:phage shock protein A